MSSNKASSVKLPVKISRFSSLYYKKWKISWDKSLGEILKDRSGRVYLIVVNGLIYKIGGSVDKKGIIGTMGWYQNNAFTGGPSIRTHGIHILINREIEKGNQVEIYMILSNKVIAEIKGLFGVQLKLVSIDFKEMEDLCKNQYFQKCGQYPKWNFQENNEQWDVDLIESCNLVNVSSANKRKS